MPTPENLATDATVAIMLADGFETVEALAVADILFRAGVRTDLISVTDARHVTSSHGIRVVADLMLEDVDLSTYTVLFLPGGLPGTTNLRPRPRSRQRYCAAPTRAKRWPRSARPPRSSLSWACSTVATRPANPAFVRPSPPEAPRPRQHRPRRRLHHDQPRCRNLHRPRPRDRVPAPGGGRGRGHLPRHRAHPLTPPARFHERIPAPHESA